MSQFIPVNEPLLNGNEKKYLNECIESGWVSSEGKFVSRFELGLGKLINRDHCIAVSNGSDALELAVDSLDLQPNDEVILPAFTIISCAQAVVRAGAKPVLVDTDPRTWNMDVARIEERITPKTKAIMAVHTYGLPVDMQPVLQLAEKYDLKIIEDAAEAIGQNYYGRPCGSFGDVSVFSFYANKHVTTGEGGMIATNNTTIAAHCKGGRNLFFGNSTDRFTHKKLGWNMRLSNLQAAVGVAQVESLQATLQRKRDMGLLYTELLSGLPGIQLPISNTDFAENHYWVFGIVVDEMASLTATDAMRQLGELGVGTRPFFLPMHKQPIFQEMGLFHEEEFPISERLAQFGFYLPSGAAITDQQIEYVAKKVRLVLG